MDSNQLRTKIDALKSQLDGDIFTDQTQLLLHATDASAYREIPLGVARPKHAEDIKKLIEFANAEKIPLIQGLQGHRWPARLWDMVLWWMFHGI